MQSPAHAVIATYAYDGLNRRISKTTGGHTFDHYYNEQWQAVQVDKDGQAPCIETIISKMKPNPCRSRCEPDSDLCSSVLISG